MHSKSGRKSISRPPDFNNHLKLKGCGLINCRSCLGVRNPIREEIQQILTHRFRGDSSDSRSDPEPPALHKDFSK
jgi:hypothetical protein